MKDLGPFFYAVCFCVVGFSVSGNASGRFECETGLLGANQEFSLESGSISLGTFVGPSGGRISESLAGELTLAPIKNLKLSDDVSSGAVREVWSFPLAFEAMNKAANTAESESKTIQRLATAPYLSSASQAGEALGSPEYMTQARTRRRDLLWEHSSISFIDIARSSKQKIKLLLKTSGSEVHSELTGHTVHFEHELPARRRQDWTVLYLRNFRAVDETGKTIAGLSISREDKIVGLGFSVDHAVDVLPVPKTLRLGVSLPSAMDVTPLYVTTIVSRPYSEYAPLPESGVIFNKFFQQMNLPRNQAYAVKVVQGGPDSVARELGKYGLQSTVTLNGKVSLFQIMKLIGVGNVPIEGGRFGTLHGAYAHHAQLLAGLKGLNARERNVFLYYLCRHLASGVSENWPMWDLLFDSRGEGIHGNRYWRDLLK